MNKTIWTKFSDKRSNINGYIFVADSDGVYIRHTNEVQYNHKYTHWAPIVYPEPPDRHSCGFENIIDCSEEIDGKLYMSIWDKDGTSRIFIVNSCPYCGYSPKDKK